MNRYDAKVYLNNQIFTNYPTLYGNNYDYFVRIVNKEINSERRLFNEIIY